MPVALDPNARYEVVLQSDRGKSPAPTFIFKVLTVRESHELLRIAEQLQVNGSAETIAAIMSALRIAMVNWRDMVGPDGVIEYAPGNLEGLISIDEAVELFEAMVAAFQIRRDTAKKSGSPSPSNTEGSARAAGGGDVSTGPAPISPSNSSVRPAVDSGATTAAPATSN